MKCPKEIDKAYLAGVLDSDGSIYLAYSNKKKVTLRSGIGVTNRDLKMLQWIQETFANGWTSASPKQPKCRRAFVFQIGSKKNVAYILKMVLPYLQSKKQQAELVLEFCQNHKNRVYTERDWELFKELKILNKRGD